MLQFFRQYQRFFFIVTTVFIVISFSFFGTYSAFDTSGPVDRDAFTAVDGKTIKASELEAMAMFLNTDKATHTALGGVWGGNFLNDGVVVNDFLKSGLAEALFADYGEHLAEDLLPRHRKEKRASFYAHPQASFVSAEGAWGYFAPAVAKSVRALRAADEATSTEGFKARIDLYLAEQEFPASALRQVLQYQQQQYSWLPADPNLARTDLSLFGYHTTEDWFGMRFLRLASECIINAAKIAQARGYQVSMAEARADLIDRAEHTYRDLPQGAAATAGRPVAYMREQLRRMGLTERQAVKIWQQVLLFRRLVNGVGDAVFVDALTFSQYSEFALEKADGILYSTAPDLRLPDFRALQKFQAYLSAVAGQEMNAANLELPKKTLDVDTIRNRFPAMAQKRYMLDIASVSKKSLQVRVGVKEMWEWQVQDQNWAVLKEQFPELGVLQAGNIDERFAALDALEPTTRQRVDEYSRGRIVEAHPEWLDQALSDAQSEQKEVSIRLEGGSFPFHGLEDRAGLIGWLDAAPLSGEGGSAEAQEELRKLTGDQEHYYRVGVAERSSGWEILSFAEAQQGDFLEAELLKVLEPFYVTLRQADPKPYRQEDQSWKSLEEVRDLVAAEYFKPLLTAIHQERPQANSASPQSAAHYRFYQHMHSALKAIQADSAAEDVWVYQKAELEPSLLKQRPALAEQWLLRKSKHGVGRSDDRSMIDVEAVFDLDVDTWSSVQAGRGGGLWFFHLDSKGPVSNEVVAGQQMARLRDLLAGDARRLMFEHLLGDIRSKNAIDLSYLIRDRETSQPQESAHEKVGTAE